MKILAYTVSYGSKLCLPETVKQMRATAGVWFDWAVWLGAPSEALLDSAQDALGRKDRLGIQFLSVWPENRGQHHATKAAFDLAKAEGYDYIVRIDDDITPRTKRWLKRLVDYTEELKRRAKDDKMRIVSAPRLVGLNNPPQPVGAMNVGQKFAANVMDVLGGGVRLHPVEFFDGYEPPLFDPLGRGDPVSIADWVEEHEGVLVQFPTLRVVHNTNKLEAKDTKEQAVMRKMSRLWCYLGPGVPECDP